MRTKSDLYRAGSISTLCSICIPPHTYNCFHHLGSCSSVLRSYETPGFSTFVLPLEKSELQQVRIITKHTHQLPSSNLLGFPGLIGIPKEISQRRSSTVEAVCCFGIPAESEICIPRPEGRRQEAVISFSYLVLNILVVPS